MIGDESLVAVSEDTAARIAGINKRRLRYWDETDVISPSVTKRLGPRSVVRLYSFQDAFEVLAAAALRDELSLQQIRKVIAHLRARGYDRPLAQLTFATGSNGELYFQHPDGEWEGISSPDQIVFEKTLRLDRIRHRLESSLTRAPKLAGKVQRRRGVLGSKPVFAGTRLPVATVVTYLRRGYGIERIMEAFPVLTEADVEVARQELRSA